METEKEDHLFKVTREETDRYLREVKDQNPIHQGEGAIVPGFLMANKILKQLSPQIPFQAEFRFLTPLQIERSGWLEFLSSDEENDPKIEAEKALKKVQKIHLRTPQNIILKAEITEYKESKGADSYESDRIKNSSHNEILQYLEYTKPYDYGFNDSTSYCFNVY